MTLVRGVLRAQIAPGVYVDLVRVPPGKFLMGSDPASDENAQKDEMPRREIELGEFWIAKFPLTVAQFTSFTSATNRLTPFDYPQKSDYPITSVSWFDALVFCRWASDNTGKEWRLPTEAEWEKAARGTDGRIYPWGNEFDAVRCNSAEGKANGTTAVEEFSTGVSPYGAWDMVGNVWEWTNDWYRADAYVRAAEQNPQGPETGSYKALRGGAWFSDQFHVRAADRTHINPENRYDYVGFRPVLASGL
jgi:formylglycine-generating enzyme required for sulfatase activity